LKLKENTPGGGGTFSQNTYNQIVMFFIVFIIGIKIKVGT
jgi:hypothetical protein